MPACGRILADEAWLRVVPERPLRGTDRSVSFANPASRALDAAPPRASAHVHLTPLHSRAHLPMLQRSRGVPMVVGGGRGATDVDPVEEHRRWDRRGVVAGMPPGR